MITVPLSYQKGLPLLPSPPLVSMCRPVPLLGLFVSSDFFFPHPSCYNSLSVRHSLPLDLFAQRLPGDPGPLGDYIALLELPFFHS